jgi:hypothetical protein
MRRFVVWNSMQNEWGNGSWALLEQDSPCPFIVVRTHLGTKATQLGAHPPDLLARILMKEIYNERTPGHID